MKVAVLNNSGATILQNKAVRQASFDYGLQLPVIELASAAAVDTATVLGLVVEDIVNGGAGLVEVSGPFGPIDTSAFATDAPVYLSDTPGEISPTSGTITSIIGNVKTAAVDGCIDISCSIPSVCSQGGGGAVGIADAHMNLQGPLVQLGPLPVYDLGSEIMGYKTTLIDFRGRRRVPGISGTTTIQLEVNGGAIPGATLSWSSTDPAFTLKEVTINLAVDPGDRLSFRLTSREGGNPEDIFTEVNA